MKLSYAFLAIANAAAASVSGMPNSNTIELVAADLDQAGTGAVAADPAALLVADVARVADPDNASRAPKPSLRATADLPIAAVPAPSCEGAGDGCGAGSFCNHPGGDGGMCVTCPVKEEHCTDFGGATDACLLACFQGGADGAPASLGVRAGSSLGLRCSATNPCPSGWCCSQYGWCGNLEPYCGESCQSGCWKSTSWEELPPNTQHLFGELGYHALYWNNKLRPEPAAFQSWHELSSAHRAAASALGYTESSWDSADAGVCVGGSCHWFTEEGCNDRSLHSGISDCIWKPDDPQGDTTVDATAV